MEEYKRQFIDFMVESEVLKFGEFTLKSGRKSPFFMNAGAYVTGSQLKRLGEFYAKAIHDNFGLDFDVLFGPAYKGIPLAVSCAIAMHDLYGKEVRYCSNRKEVKDHGADKGNLLGSELRDGDRVVMIEDVTTSGKSIDETYPIVTGAAKVEVKGLIVSLNRMEVGKGGKVSAQEEIQERYGFPVASIVTMAEVVEALDGTYLLDWLDTNVAQAGDTEYPTVEEAVKSGKEPVQLLWDATWDPTTPGEYVITTNGHDLEIGGDLDSKVADNGDGTITVTVTDGTVHVRASSIAVGATTVRVGVEGIKAGCWYALEKTTDLAQPFVLDEETWASASDLLAGTGELEIALAENEPCAFYQIRESETPPAP